MAYYKRTRLNAQDMKTGEWCYADQLIKDGYYPNLMVLPKNYDPPQPVGQSLRLPLEPMFNVSPPNIHDEVVIDIGALIDPNTGGAPLLPVSTGTVGNFLYSVDQNITGISSQGSVGMVTPSIAVLILGTSSQGSVGIVTPSYDVTGVSSQGNVGMVNQQSVGNISVNIMGNSSQGSVGTVPNGSGWGSLAWGEGAWGSS